MPESEINTLECPDCDWTFIYPGWYNPNGSLFAATHIMLCHPERAEDLEVGSDTSRLAEFGIERLQHWTKLDRNSIISICNPFLGQEE